MSINISYSWSTDLIDEVMNLRLTEPDEDPKFKQAMQAFKAIDFLVDNDIKQGIEAYIKLDMSGRVISLNIANKQDDHTSRDIFEKIAPYINEGLDLSPKIYSNHEEDKQTKYVIIKDDQESKLNNAIEALKTFYEVNEQCEKELNEFKNPNGCLMNTHFKQVLFDIINNEENNQDNFNAEIAGLVIEFCPN